MPSNDASCETAAGMGVPGATSRSRMRGSGGGDIAGLMAGRLGTGGGAVGATFGVAGGSMRTELCSGRLDPVDAHAASAMSITTADTRTTQNLLGRADFIGRAL